MCANTEVLCTCYVVMTSLKKNTNVMCCVIVIMWYDHDRQMPTNLVKDVEDLLPVKLYQNPFNGCGEEVEKKKFQPIRGQVGHLG